jgi:predicted dehydrogenase
MFDENLARPAMRWRLDRTVASAGALGDLGIHMIDMARFLVGEFATVCGQTWNFARERRAGEEGPPFTVTVEDAGAYLAEFANGATGVFHTSRNAPGRGDYMRIEVYGREGSAIFQRDRLDRILACTGRLQMQRQTYTEYVAQESDLAYKSVMHAFVEGLQGGISRAPTLADGLRAQEVLDAVLCSAAERRWLAVDGDKGKIETSKGVDTDAQVLPT